MSRDHLCAVLQVRACSFCSTQFLSQPAIDSEWCNTNSEGLSLAASRTVTKEHAGHILLSRTAFCCNPDSEHEIVAMQRDQEDFFPLHFVSRWRALASCLFYSPARGHWSREPLRICPACARLLMTPAFTTRERKKKLCGRKEKPQKAKKESFHFPYRKRNSPYRLGVARRGHKKSA